MANEKVLLIDEFGNAYGVKHIDNKPRVSSVSYLNDIAEGNVSGHTAIDVNGYAPSLSNTVYDTIWNVGGQLTYLTAAEILKVSSDDVNDTSAGTGARTIVISGLDGSYNEISETITMNGTTVVSTSNSYLRLFEACVDTVGSDTSQTNIGNITIENNAQTSTLSIIKVGIGCTGNVFWTVPAGKTLYMAAYYFAAMKSKDLDLRIFKREFGKAFLSTRAISIKDNPFLHTKRMPIKFPEKTDIEFRGLAKDISGGGFVSAGFDGWME